MCNSFRSSLCCFIQPNLSAIIITIIIIRPIIQLADDNKKNTPNNIPQAATQQEHTQQYTASSNTTRAQPTIYRKQQHNKSTPNNIPQAATHSAHETAVCHNRPNSSNRASYPHHQTVRLQTHKTVVSAKKKNCFPSYFRYNLTGVILVH